jgi:hypothetical protein
MTLKNLLINNIAKTASAKLAGDFYDDMLLRSNKFYENAAPLQPKITPTNKAPNAKGALGRAGVAALLAGAGGIYLTKKLRDINSLIKSPGE